MRRPGGCSSYVGGWVGSGSCVGNLIEWDEGVFRTLHGCVWVCRSEGGVIGPWHSNFLSFHHCDHCRWAWDPLLHRFNTATKRSFLFFLRHFLMSYSPFKFTLCIFLMHFTFYPLIVIKKNLILIIFFIKMKWNDFSFWMTSQISLTFLFLLSI